MDSYYSSMNERLLNTAIKKMTENDVKIILSQYYDLYDLKMDCSKALHMAVAFQKPEIVKLLLAEGANINFKERKGGLTPLHFAVKRRDLVMASLLLENNADIDQETKHQSTALHIAVENEDKEMVRLILDKGANLNAKKFGKTPLHLAVEKTNLEVAQMLLDKGCNINETCVGGSSALHLAIQAKNSEMARLLLDHNPNTGPNDFGYTPLYLAVREECTGALKALLQRLESDESRTATERRNDKGRAAELAFNQGNKKIVDILLEHGLDPNWRPARGSLLHLAVECGWLDSMEQLLQLGADPSAVGGRFRTPVLQLALQLCNEKAVRMLVEWGADVNGSESRKGMRCLHVAVRSGSMDMVGLMLARGADIDALSKNGLTALHVAFEVRRRDLVELLLQRGASARPPKYGAGPFEAAVEMESVELCERLLDGGLPAEATCWDGSRLVAWTLARRGLRIARLLLERGAAPADPRDALSPLLEAVRHRYTAGVRLLLEFGASANTRERGPGKRSALQVAIMSACDDEVLVALLEHGADINHVAADGSTALLLALDRCSERMVQRLVDSGANARLRRPEGPTALRRAIRLDWPRVVMSMLLRGAADGADQQALGEALVFAVARADLEMFELLLRLGAPPLLELGDGRTLLHVAAARHCPEIVQELLERGVPLDGEDLKASEGLTALHVALVSGNEKGALQLLGYGANAHLRERHCRRTALHLAAETGCLEVVRRLLCCYGLAVDERACGGLTPLHAAAAGGQPHVAKLLLSYGANVNSLSNQEHLSALHRCCRADSGGYEVAEVLLAAGARVFTCACHLNSFELGAFHYAKMYVRDPRFYQLMLQYDSSPANAEFLRRTFVSHFDNLRVSDTQSEVFVRHMARKGIPLTLEDVQDMQILYTLYDDCQVEMERMDQEFFYENLSYCELLRRSLDELRPLVRNTALMEALANSNYRKKFPLYADILQDYVERACKLEQFYIDGELLMHRIFALPIEIAQEILKLLPVTDVCNLIEVLPHIARKRAAN